VRLAGYVQSFEEQLYLLRRLSSQNGQKTFILLGRCSLSSHVIHFHTVNDFVLVKVVDESGENRIQLVQQKNVVLTNPRRVPDIRVAPLHVNISANILKVGH